MRAKSSHPPMTERRFAGPWAELNYVCKKIRYWLYTQRKKLNACRYLGRLEKVLQKLPENKDAILREEALALLYQLKGKIQEAIAHRDREIELMGRLHKEAASPRYAPSTRAYMLRDRDETALRERQRILHSLKAYMGMAARK